MKVGNFNLKKIQSIHVKLYKNIFGRKDRCYWIAFIFYRSFTNWEYLKIMLVHRLTKKDIKNQADIITSIEEEWEN